VKKLQNKMVFLAAAVVILLGVAGYSLFQPIPFEKKKPIVGDFAPEFSLIDLKSGTVRLSDFQGKVVLLNFWASWCAPCKDEMPGFQNVFLAYYDKGFRVIAVAMNDPEPLSLVKELGIVFPVTWANEQVHRDYGYIVHLPVSFLIGKDGKIVKKVFGAYSETDLRRDVEQALK